MDERTEIPFLKSQIREFTGLSKQLSEESKGTFRWIIWLVIIGVFLVVFLPYILISIDNAFISTITQEQQEVKISKIQDEITKLEASIPPLTWVPLNSQTDQDLYSAVFSPDGIGVITGDNGTLLLSLDGGRTWTPQNSQTDKNLR